MELCPCLEDDEQRGSLVMMWGEEEGGFRRHAHEASENTAPTF